MSSLAGKGHLELHDLTERRYYLTTFTKSIHVYPAAIKVHLSSTQVLRDSG